MGVGAGLYIYVVVVQKFTFTILSPDEFLLRASAQYPATACHVASILKWSLNGTCMFVQVLWRVVQFKDLSCLRCLLNVHTVLCSVSSTGVLAPEFQQVMNASILPSVFLCAVTVALVLAAASGWKWILFLQSLKVFCETCWGLAKCSCEEIGHLKLHVKMSIVLVIRKGRLRCFDMWSVKMMLIGSDIVRWWKWMELEGGDVRGSYR